MPAGRQVEIQDLKIKIKANSIELLNVQPIRTAAEMRLVSYAFISATIGGSGVLCFIISKLKGKALKMSSKELP